MRGNKLSCHQFRRETEEDINEYAQECFVSYL